MVKLSQRHNLGLVMVVVFVLNLIITEGCFAAAKSSSLTLTLDTNNVAVDITPSADGEFGDSADATITVNTDNFTGYTLQILSKGSTSLTSTSGQTIESIDSSITENTFKNNSSYNNKWGYKPSQYVTSSNGVNIKTTNVDNYLPAPTTSGDTLDITDAPNSSSNSYTISIGARADFDLDAGAYTGDFMIVALSNDVVYNVTYDKNTEDTVQDMPSVNPQGTEIAGGTAAEDSYMTLSDAVPTRTGFTFAGWCDTKPVEDATTKDQTCEGNTYAAGSDLGIDQTTDGTNIVIYAIWKVNNYAIVHDYQEDYSYNADGFLDTGWKIDWGKDFKIETTFRIPTAGKRYAIVANYNNSAYNLNLEINASNQIRLYMASGGKDITQGSVPVNTDVNLVFTWNAKTKAYGLTATASGMTDINISGNYPEMTDGVATRNLYTGRDQRGSSTFTPLTMKSLKITDYHPYNVAIGELPTVAKVGYNYDGWYTEATGGTKVNATDLMPDHDVTYYVHSAAKTYTITLNGNGATTAGSTSATATYDATTLSTITNPSRAYNISGFTLPASNNAAGATVSSTSTLTSTYTFNGWYKESGATNKIASNATTPALQASTSYTDANSKWTNDGAVTLYAGWTAQAKTLPTITKTGYTCGWTTTATNATTITYASGGSITPTAATTLYGVCTAKTYTITLNGNGGTLGSTTTTATYDATTLSTITNPTRANSTYTVSGFTNGTSSANATISSAASKTSTRTYTFNGWYKESGATNKIASNATTPALQASTSYTDANSKWTNDGAVTLYAGWTASSYSAVTLPTITRTGSTCGWATSSTATTWTYNSGASMTPTGNTVLYGVCRNNITLNGNGATTAGSTSATVDYNATALSTITLPQRKYTVSGFTIPASNNADGATVSSTSTLTSTYTFNGWYKESGATNKIAGNTTTPALEASTTYTNVSKQWTYTTAGAITLYAGWTSQAKTLPTITKPGYTCGWTTTATNATTITYASGASFTLTANTTLYGVCTANNYTVTVKAGNGISTLTLSDWTGTGTGTLTKTYHINETIDLSDFAPTYKTGYSGVNNVKNDTAGSISGTTYTVGAGDGDITINATTLATPVCTMQGGTTKVYNRSATTLTATSNADSYDADSVNITYSFGYATSATATLGNFGTAQAGNTLSIAKAAFRGARYYGVTVVVTDKNDSSITATCTSGTGTNTGTNVANRTTMTLVNSRVQFDAGDGTIASGNNPIYVYYGGTAIYTTRTGSTAATMPTVTPPTGYDFNGWFTAATDGSKVLNADGTATGTAVSSWTNASKQWVKTGTSDSATTAANILHAQYSPKTYTITLNGNGATTAGSTSATATYDATTLSTITNPSRAYNISGFTLPASNNAAGATVSSTSTLTSTYTFNGWYKESGATNKIASNATTPALQASTSYTDANSKWTNDGAVTLYAGWTAQAKTLPTITKTGYTCGWTTTATNATTITYASGGSITPTAATTLYGVCTAKTYTITLNGNGGTLGSTTTTATYDATTLSTITNPTKANATGTRTVSGFTLTTSGANATVSSTNTLNSTNTTTYTFNGWYKESGATNKIASNATTPALQASTSYTDANSKWTNDGAVTLYAGWTASAGSYSAVTLPTITRTGSTCGWATSSTATTWNYASGASMTPTANTVLYGVCRTNITLNRNGGNAGSTSATVNYGATALSTITVPTRADSTYTVSGFTLTTSGTNATVSSTANKTSTQTYTFKGWYKESGATNKIAGTTATPALEASTTYTNASNQWTYTTAGAITLYAGWTASGYSAVTLPTITRTGSTCGWATSSTATTWNYASGASMTPTANTVLYGVCRNNIVLNGNGATTAGTASATVNYNATSLSTITLPQRKYTVSGFTIPASNNADGATVSSTSTLTSTYTFNGWYKESGATNKIAGNTTTPALEASTTYTNVSKQWTYTTAGAITLYAGWTSQAKTLPTITKTGYTCGWTTTATNATTITYASGASFTPTANTTLYGVCTAKTYTITLNGNGATTAGSTSATATYNATTLSAITVPQRKYTVSGFTKTTSGTNATISATSTLTSTYTFNGWYKESGATNKIASNATTPALQASTSYTDANSKWTNDGAVTLYAGWSGAAVTLPTITRTGSTCGWATSSTATTWTYNSGASITPTSNLTLYGVCRNNITLNNAGATTAGSTSATVNYNATALSTITLPQRKYTVSGFTKTTSATNSTVSATTTLTNTATFNGWYTASSGGTKIAAGGTDTTPDLQASTTYTNASKQWTYTTAGAITLYSQWTDNAVTLPTITRTGSTCGWATSSTATTWTYNSGASITPTSNLTLYGVCRNNITLNGNGATTAGSTSATVDYNATALSTITLPQRKYTVSGFTIPASNNADGATVSSTSTLTSTYTFNGWYKESGATNKIAGNTTTPALEASTTYTNVSKQWTYTTAGAITLYAGWTSQAKTLPTITKTGYTCGWTTTATNATTITYASGASFTPTANTTLYGVCTANKYKLTITFAGSGVSSVQVRTASGASGGTLMGTVSASGGSVSNLVYGTNYYLYPTFQDGYELSKWAKTDSATNASLSSTTAANPYYTIGAGNGAVTITGTDCPGGNVCYKANGTSVDGTMANQTISASATSINLYPSNFSRAGYGFAGWNTKADGTGTNYGPMETITITAGQYANDGLRLYAKWVQSAGNLQDWTCPASMAVGTVTALKDTRDNDVYAVAKLADGKCWMIENLRLDNTATLTTSNTNNPLYSGSTVTLKHNYTDTTTYNTLSPNSDVAYDATSAPNGWCSTNSAACNDQSRLRTDNTTSRATNTTTSGNIYSYGNYYNWYSATAGRGTYGFGTNNNSVAGDLCPKGWHLPKGGNKSNEANNEFWSLIVTGLNNGTNPANYESTTQPYYTGNPEGNDVSKLVRAYPNNFVYSGYVHSGSVSTRGSFGYYWSSTASSSDAAYNLYFGSSYVSPGTGSYNRYSGRTVRCVMDAAPPANTVVYVGNGADAGTMADQTISASATSINLYPSNFSRSGYGFAGWNTKADGTGTNYGPMETVSITAGQYSTVGLKLYAHWIPSAGNLQSWSGCSSLAQGAVTALKDTRDNQVYAVAKLADGKCWMIENLRLDNTATLTTSNTNNPLYSGSTVTLKHNYTDTTTYNTLSPNSDVAYNATSAPNGWCSANSAACDDQSRLRTDNTASRATNTTDSGNIYSYGNYYNWYSATAGRGTYGMSSGNTAGDLCPKGWHLPTGNSSGEFYALNTNANAGATNTSAGLRSYPNNFVYSGYVNSGSVSSRGSTGSYWSSTAVSSSSAYYLYFSSSGVGPGTSNFYKYRGGSVRCVR